MDKLASGLDSVAPSGNITYGENGAPAVASLGNHFLEIFSKNLTRGSTPHLKVSADSSPEDVVTAAVLAFYARSIHNGSGERLIFYQMFGDLLSEYPTVMLKTLALIPNPEIGGSWNDLNRLTEYLLETHPRRTSFLLQANDVRTAVVELYAQQLYVDHTKVLAGETTVSLAAKWAPSEKTHFWKLLGTLLSRRVHVLTAGHVSSYSRMNATYRHILSTLRRTIDVVEVKMCGQRWSQIDFQRVPGVAMRQYGRWAFPNKIKGAEGSESTERSRLEDRVTCAEQFAAYKKRAEKGEAKVHGTTVGLHQYGTEFEKCLRDPTSDSAQLLELQFRDLLENLRKNTSGDIDVTKLIPLVDVSGSMGTQIAGSVSAMSIAIQLGLILSQLDLTSPFADRVLTFSDNPVWVMLKDHATYLAKYRAIQTSQWSMSTDFEKAFNLILSTAVERKLTPAEMQGFKLIVFSDMQFNAASKRPWNTLHKELTHKFQKAGYPLPGIIYWNLAARETNGFAVDASQTGAIMVSGFGTGQLKAMLAGDLHSATPLDKMYETLSNPVFDSVRDVVSKELVSMR